MSHLLLILRPQPGAASTARAAQAMGVEAIVVPLFTINPVAWRVPGPDAHDALLLTSANAARHAGPALAELATMPTYTVGQATADAARGAGLIVTHAGSSDVAALLSEMHAAGVTRPLHLTGRDHRDSSVPGVTITRRIVYASEAAATLPAVAVQALDADAVVLLHSPRAAGTFATLLDRPRADVAIAALSEAVARAAGPGWRAVAIAAAPDDGALLAAAAGLCDGPGLTAKGPA